VGYYSSGKQITSICNKPLWPADHCSNTQQTVIMVESYSLGGHKWSVMCCVTPSHHHAVHKAACCMWL